jgi:hypothetical protein
MKPLVDSFSDPQSFEVASGALRVTDPCYGVDVWCSGQLENVKNGTWHAKVGYYKDPFDEEQTRRYFDDERERVEGEMKFFEETLTNHKTLSDEDRVKVAELRNNRLAALNAKMQANLSHPGRVSVIGIVHESVPFSELEKFNWAWVQGLDVGVDSGQAGFFDLAKYTEAVSDKNDRGEDGCNFKAFYRDVCDLTLTDASWGVVPFGAVSSSGYGDGDYNCFVLRKPISDPAVSELVGAYIVFISEEENEE